MERLTWLLNSTPVITCYHPFILTVSFCVLSCLIIKHENIIIITTFFSIISKLHWHSAFLRTPMTEHCSDNTFCRYFQARHLQEVIVEHKYLCNISFAEKRLE